MRFYFCIVFGSLLGCTANNASTLKTDYISINSLVNDPQKFDNQSICSTGYVYAYSYGIPYYLESGDYQAPNVIRPDIGLKGFSDSQKVDFCGTVRIDLSCIFDASDTVFEKECTIPSYIFLENTKIHK